MAEKAKKTNKNLIIGICIAVVIVAIIAVAAFFATRGTQLNDAYFVSDGTKYVITMDGDTMSTSEDNSYPPIKTHMVYYYSGDNITGMNTYMEFTDETSAKNALEYYKQTDQSGIESISTNGKYIVIVMTKDNYSDMTASEVKQYLDFMESLQNFNYNDNTEE